MKNLSTLVTLIIFSTLATAQTLYVPSGTGGIGTSTNSNVGIGTTASPLDALHVAKVGNNQLVIQDLSPATGGVGGGLKFLGYTSGTSGANYFATIQGIKSNGDASGIFKISTSDNIGTSLERMRVDGLGRVGIGTATPSSKLNIIGDASGSNSIIDIGANGSNTNLKMGLNTDYAWIQSYGSRPLYLNDIGNNIILNGQYGNVGIGTYAPAGKLHINTNSWMSSLLSLSDTHYGPSMIYHFQIESDGLKIKHDNTIDYLFKSGGDFVVNNGTIHSKEVKVSLTPGSGPDYVFEPDYKLLSLEEIKSYIEKNKHLPEVPSAKEMETNGVNVSEMNMLLLKKIEELTLYQIEAMKLINSLKSELDQLKTTNNKQTN